MTTPDVTSGKGELDTVLEKVFAGDDVLSCPVSPGRAMWLILVAGGVETIEQVRFVQERGCHNVQR